MGSRLVLHPKCRLALWEAISEGFTYLFPKGEMAMQAAPCSAELLLSMVGPVLTTGRKGGDTGRVV